MIEKGHEEKLLQIHSTNYFKARVGAKKTDSTIIKVPKQGNVIRRTLGKKFETHIWITHPVYPYVLEESLILKL